MKKCFFAFTHIIHRNRKLPGKIVDRLFVAKLREIPFIVFLSFLVTFIVSRAYVYVTNHDILETPLLLKNISINGVHVHHLNYGIIILSIVGFRALYNINPAVHRKLAGFFGIGLGLTFDEFALWLQLKDDYYASMTYDAIITISVILLSCVYFPDFWAKTGPQLQRLGLLLARRIRCLFSVSPTEIE
jgi:hypothetical protein